MKKSKGLGLSDRKENENKKTRTGIAFRLVAKCLHCGLSSFGADQSNCPLLLLGQNRSLTSQPPLAEAVSGGVIEHGP
ncbi:MAG: hypothetical protein ACK57P_06020, partial [Planctomycetota bacterium]